jgi:hypothetical protein
MTLHPPTFYVTTNTDTGSSNTNNNNNPTIITKTPTLEQIVIPGTHPKECRVLIHGPFSLAVQLLLGVVSVLGLMLKWRMFDKPKPRPRNVWLLDAAKIGISGGLGAHGLNVACAILLARHTESYHKEGSQTVDECAFYLVNYLFDVVCGIPLAWLLVTRLEQMARKYGWTSLQHSGFYGDPPSLIVWRNQVLTWSGILVTSKLICLIPLYLFSIHLLRVAMLLVAPWSKHPKQELLAVMIYIPSTFNLCTILIFDQMLQGNNTDHKESFIFFGKPSWNWIRRNNNNNSNSTNKESMPLLSSSNTAEQQQQPPQQQQQSIKNNYQTTSR